MMLESMQHSEMAKLSAHIRIPGDPARPARYPQKLPWTDPITYEDPRVPFGIGGD